MKARKRSKPTLKRPKLSLSLPKLSISLVISWLLLLTIIISLTYILFSPWLRVQYINCHYFNHQPCPSEIQAELQKHQHQPILFLSINDLVSRLSTGLPQVSQVNIDIHLPQTLSASFETQPLYANIQTSSSSASLIVSRQYQVIHILETPDSTLPSITYDKATDITISDQITDPALLFALDLIDQLNQHYLPVKPIFIYSPQEIALDLPHNQLALFDSQQDITRQVTSLQSILSKATIDSSLPVIDLRYNQPVLKPSR